jgi:hypothetical protein
MQAKVDDEDRPRKVAMMSARIDQGIFSSICTDQSSEHSVQSAHFTLLCPKSKIEGSEFCTKSSKPESAK